ncbi:MAG: hypothetical protein N2712_05260 [Brevinematales bacterium]|nr:hypothetical protein [Brevinematales bacterium]
MRVKVGNVSVEDETGGDLHKEILDFEYRGVRIWKGIYRVSLVIKLVYN